MPLPIPSSLVEYLLLGPQDDRRQLQDTPILGDVWVKYGEKPERRLDLLITPHRGIHAGEVADAIDRGLSHADGEDLAQVAPVQGLVAARLTFEELLRVVIPKSRWWIAGRRPVAVDGTEEGAASRHELSNYTPKKLESLVERVLASAREWIEKRPVEPDPERGPLDRFIALAGLLLWSITDKSKPDGANTTADLTLALLDKAKAKKIAARLADTIKIMAADNSPTALVWQVSVNRTALPALSRSIPAVKADAAKTLFGVSCKKLAWAVLDSGIDGGHPAFADKAGTSRVRRSFDFRRLRDIVSLGNSRPGTLAKTVASFQADKSLLRLPADPAAALQQLANDARTRRPIDWSLVERFVEIAPTTAPMSDHGTHVAGIIGASKEAALAMKPADGDAADGMCPDIGLYDFRVLGSNLMETEFAIISALQYIRYLNDQDTIQTINGANLSLSIPHDVRNYACGRTPVCVECERLVESGVVVVAAAGNHGYKSFETKDGLFDGYAAFSVTDPGNADGVITVGSTHRFWPHTYGVSFFSSRGPTGDGRMKPDLVAPGERIRAPFRGGAWGDLDGTSMAAPHVSGAAAMLLARYSELVGRPRLVKQVLCDTATDLGRERSFQGRGMLDVLRALQSV